MKLRMRLEGAQRLGRALMLPIAVLPVAGLLLRIGQPDLLDIAWMAAAGNAIFSNLGLLFAIGVAVGFARENHGAAGLAAVVGYVVTTKGAEVLLDVPPDVVAGFEGAARDLAAAGWKAREIAKLSVPVGILSGLVAGALYNRYSDIRLPDYLAFFGGRRFVPIASGFAALILAAAFGYGWPVLEHGMDVASRAVLDAGGVGLFVYGVLNRLLIVTGLHHILNNLAWFLLGDYGGVTGDLNRFFAGDPTAGRFMSGFFPVMMFGLPGACLAMYRTARPERRRAVGGLLLSMALTSFLTGVTEPVEFTFMFLAPLLYAVHAVLTGTAMVLMHWLEVRLGFGFSAGLFDYALNFRLAHKPLWLLPVGVAYFALYYALFRYVIVKFDLRTPGREAETAGGGIDAGTDADASTVTVTTDSAAIVAGAAQGTGAMSGAGAMQETGAVIGTGAAAGSRGDARGGAGTPVDFVTALGGPENLRSVDACTTRLRLEVRDQARVDEAALRRLGAHGLVRPSATALQVVLGPIADQVAEQIRRQLRAGASGGAATRPLAATMPRAATAATRAVSVASVPVTSARATTATSAVAAAATPDTAPTADAPSPASPLPVTEMLRALGGEGNIADISVASTRLRVRVRDDSAVDAAQLIALSPRGGVRAAPQLWHLIVGPGVERLAAELHTRIAN